MADIPPSTTTKLDATKPDLVNADTAKTNVTKTDGTKTDGVKADATQSDPINADMGKVPAKPDLINDDSATAVTKPVANKLDATTLDATQLDSTTLDSTTLRVNHLGINKLTSANLTSARLISAKLTSAKLTSAKRLPGEQPLMPSPLPTQQSLDLSSPIVKSPSSNQPAFPEQVDQSKPYLFNDEGHVSLNLKVIGMAIATSTLPVFLVGISAYIVTYHPSLIQWSGLGTEGIIPSSGLQPPFVWGSLGAIGIAMGCGLVSAYWFQKTFQTMLNGMSVAQVLNEEELATRVSDERTDEVNHLGRNINQMADQIQALLQERDQQTHQLQIMNDELEGRVRQRTSQLSRVISQLKQEILERKHTEKALQQSQVKLIHSEKMSGLGQMVAGIAHEINNPINFIHGNLKHVQGHVQDILTVLDVYQTLYPDITPELQEIDDDVDIDFLTNDLRKILESMQVGTHRILDIVRSLRTFSRMDQVEFKAVDIHEGLDSTLLILKHRLKAHSNRPQILVVKQYDEHLPLVDCQSGQINQVFMNILANAIDALEEAGDYCSQKSEPPMIIISTQKVDDDWVTIQLSDNGPGIPADVQHRLFDPFFTTKPVGKGTGLGMSISHTIITENHGGRIQLVSSSGQGATFLIELPIKRPQY